MPLRVLLPTMTAAALLALTGCSAGATTPAASGPTTPKISVAEETPAPASSAEMEKAAAFVQAVYTDDWDQAGTLVADNSLAARYVVHQQAAAQVDELNGTSNPTDPSDVDVTPDDAAKTVSVEDRSGDSPRSYLWQSFALEGDKVASWEVKGQPPLASRLWTTKASDKSDGVTAQLVSAYQGNNKTLTVVVQLASSSKNVRVNEAAYTPEDGFKHDDTSSLIPDVDKGGKTLTCFTFTKAPVGGKLKLIVDQIDPDDDSSSYSLTSLTLKVK